MNRRSFLAGVTLGLIGGMLARSATAQPTPGKGVIRGRGREIFVSLRHQRLWAYQDGKVVMTFLISSGEPSRPTRRGNFRVQSKMPEAWSNIWQLRMPYWMGIYYAGRIENGIHAMPLLRNGTPVRWPVGYPASYGCIVAKTKDAAALYRWAPLGTPVYIR
jgi:lipoprotein-anchoring transpeptidase ErfK/SrfK